MPSIHRALLLGATLVAAQDETAEVTDEDLIGLAEAALQMADDVCTDTEIDREAAEDSLRAFSLANAEGKSLLRQILDEANANNDTDLVGPATTKIQAEVASPEFLGAALGVPLAFLMLILWFLCCWQWWPCFRCCRCCKKDRGRANAPTKFVLLVSTAMGVIGCLVAAGIGMQGAADIVVGIDLALCGAAELSATTLNGDDKFTGLVPLLQEMDSLLSDTLADGSEFMTGLNDILDLTLPIEAATVGLADTITLASRALGDARNTKPKPANVAADAVITPRDDNDYGHFCEMCSATSGPLQEVADSLKSSTGTALAEQRTVIADKLQGSELDGVREQLEAAKAPLSDFRKTIYDSFNPLVGADASTGEAAKAGQQAVNMGSMALIIEVLLFPIGFTVLAVVYCLCREVSESDGQERYNAMPRRFAACAWCCSFLSAFLAFLFGGILSIVAVPVSGLCLFLINVDGELLTEQKALGFGQDPVNDAMIADSFDKCFKDGGDGRILDVMKFDRCPTGSNATEATDAEALPCQNSTTGELLDYEKVSASQFLNDEVAGQLSGAFDQIKALNLSISTANEPAFASLLALFDDYDVAAFYQVDSNSPFDQDPRYVMMNLDSRSDQTSDPPKPIEDGMAYCSFTSIKCAAQPTTPGDAVDDLATSLGLSELPGHDDCLRLAETFTLDHLDNAGATPRTAGTIADCSTSTAGGLTCEVPDITGNTDSQAAKALAACSAALDSMSGQATFKSEVEAALTKVGTGAYGSATDPELMLLWNLNGERAALGASKDYTCHPCQAAKNWLAIKDELRNNAAFTCYYFENAQGQKCDPKDTVQNGEGDDGELIWANDCMIEFTNDAGVKKYRSKIISEICDYDEWVQWYADTHTRLTNVALRVDREVAVVGDQILNRMQGLVDTALIGPVEEMIDGMNCAFIGENFGTLLDGMCRKMVPGVGSIGQSYVALGMLLWLVVITLNVVIWRYVGDNVYVSNNATE